MSATKDYLPPLAEIEKDLADTERDIEALQSITAGLRTFVYQNGGEDRSREKMDLFRYEALLVAGKSLRDKILLAKTERSALGEPEK
jgi:hypothetical protein